MTTSAVTSTLERSLPRCSAGSADGRRPAADGHAPGHFRGRLGADERDEAVEYAVALGARVAEHEPQPERLVVMLDPAGHPFCLFPGNVSLRTVATPEHGSGRSPGVL